MNFPNPITSLSVFLPLLGVLLPPELSSPTPPAEEAFPWPEGKQMALSLTFDDARPSQVQQGIALLDRYGVKATFYVLPDVAARQLEGWKAAVAKGHEIGNHSLYHPCTGNFDWVRAKGTELEAYSLEQMEAELLQANQRLEELLGVQPVSFAYPCGNTFVGRGQATQSYVPLVARLFQTGRGWLDETPNAPAFCDLAQLTGMEMDGKDFEQIQPLLEAARSRHAWLILCGHEMGTEGPQTTRLDMLEALIAYSQKPENGIWLGTVQEIAAYVREQRSH